MMVKVYNEQNVDNSVYLKLIRYGDGVAVVAVEPNGEEIDGAYLLQINSTGVELCWGFNSNAGIRMDGNHVHCEKEPE